VHDVIVVEVIQALEDLNHIMRHQFLVKLAELLE